MHRLIVTSRTYRQASHVPSAKTRTAAAIDPDNRLLWRQSPRRLEAEVCRDAILATSGLLDSTMYGQSVLPELPSELKSQYRWESTASEAQRSRRSIYLVVKRNIQLPFFTVFDVPDTHASCPRRTETTTASQALLLLNSQWTLDLAHKFARRLMAEYPDDPTRRLERAHMLAWGRPPTAAELVRADAFLAETVAAQRREADPDSAAAVTGNSARGLALIDYCHALWNTNEFMYVD